MGCLVLHNLNVYTVGGREEWQCFRHHSLFITPHPPPTAHMQFPLQKKRPKSCVRQPAESTRSVHSKRRMAGGGEEEEEEEVVGWREGGGEGGGREGGREKQSDCSTGLGFDRRRSIVLYHFS